MNGESVIYRGRLHWAVFVWPVIWFIVALIFFFKGSDDTAPFGVLAFIIAIATGIASFINYKTSEFGITNKRVIVKTGVIRRNSLEVLLNKIEGIQVNQGIVGRILGFGSIIVGGTGGTKNPVHKISSPLEFRKKVQEEIDAIDKAKSESRTVS